MEVNGYFLNQLQIEGNMILYIGVIIYNVKRHTKYTKNTIGPSIKHNNANLNLFFTLSVIFSQNIMAITSPIIIHNDKKSDIIKGNISIFS